MSTQPTVTPTPTPKPHPRSRIEQSKVLASIPTRTPKPVKPEPRDVLSRSLLDLPTSTERSIDQTREDYIRKIRRQRERDTERIAGPFADLCGIDTVAVGRAEMARRALCHRLLSHGYLPSVVSLETGIPFDEIITLKKKWGL